MNFELHFSFSGTLIKSFEVWCVRRNESKLIKHFNLVAGFYPDHSVVSEWANRTVQDAGFMAVITEFTVDTWMFSVAVVQIITLLHLYSDDAVVTVPLSIKSCCFEGCGNRTGFPAGPPSERPTSRWCCEPRQTGTSVVVCCCFLAESVPINCKALVIPAVSLLFCFVCVSNWLLPKVQVYLDYSTSSGKDTYFVKQNAHLIPLKLLNFCWSNVKYSCCFALMLIQFNHISSCVYFFPLKCQCGCMCSVTDSWALV